MNYDIEPRDKSLEHLLHRFAADQSCVGQSRDVPGDFLLQRLKPKLALPRRANGKEFVKNYDKAATKGFANATQDRSYPKWQPALLTTDIHVIQDQVRGLR